MPKLDDITAYLLQALSHPGSNLLAVLLLSLVAVAVIIFGIGKALEALAKLVGYFSGASSTVRDWLKGKRQRKVFLNRRKQFLRVLETDLAGIAKSEAWNDQHFTDLEAEVEIEGVYYSSPFKRLIRKKSKGLRRVPSLISAIDESPEKCLLVVGDPGAGKSVALRHLANQMIDRSKLSKNERSPIPLYVNLRELNIAAGEQVTVDSIKKFVMDNVRRGDADTAEYISSNWREFQENGIWFFLFDSFDEIPAVLHAAAGHEVVDQVSSAIRQFMEGLGDCRGVLASREYKSPKALQWSKLRILPLSEDRQEDLVSRTFLTSEQKQIALRTISLLGTTTYKNPLFLTLLCRYVKQHSAPPASEHELLLAHVTSLANRDSKYVLETWGLSPIELLEGATEVARLFAMESMLGLSPTFSDIAEAASRSHVLSDGQKVLKVLDALSYVKIGRTDVQSSDPNVRRFAFGHRRYQESLFAKLLIDDPAVIPVSELVVDSRWREYLVAVLQIGRGDAATQILKYATHYLGARLKTLPVRSRKYFGVEVSSYHWQDEELKRVLAMLQEGLRHSSTENMGELAASVNSIAAPLWAKGDHYDRLQIMRLCSAVRPDDLARRVEVATSSGILALEEAGVQACKYVSNPTQKLAAWVRLHILSRLLTATRRFDFLRWDAVAAELPSTFNIAPSIERVRQLSRAKKLLLMYWVPVDIALKWLPSSANPFATDTFMSGHLRIVSKVRLIGAAATYLAMICLAGVVGLLHDQIQVIDYFFIPLLLLLMCYFVRCMFQVLFLEVPERLSFRHVFSALRNFATTARGAGIPLLFLALFLIVPGAVVLGISKIFGLFDHLTWQVFPITSAILIFSAAAFGLAAMRVDTYRSRREAALKLGEESSLADIIQRATRSSTVVAACELAGNVPMRVDDVRHSVSLLTAASKWIEKPRAAAAPPWLKSGARGDLRLALNMLLQRLGEQTS